VTDLFLGGTEGASLDGPRQRGRPLPPTVATFVADALEEDILAGLLAALWRRSRQAHGFGWRTS
jgi:hypothetical protein